LHKLNTWFIHPITITFRQFLQRDDRPMYTARDAIHSTHYAVARYMSVRLSVTRRYCVEKAKHIINFFSPSSSRTILDLSRQTLRGPP